MLLGPIVIAPAEWVTTATSNMLGQEIALLQSNVRRTGSSLDVDLRWLPRGTPSQDYAVFIHVLDHAGKLVAQADGPPDSGQWPSHYWLPGVPVPDSHHLDLPTDLPPGDYQLDAGLYRPDTVERLAASRPGPEPGSISLGSIQLP